MSKQVLNFNSYQFLHKRSEHFDQIIVFDNSVISKCIINEMYIVQFDFQKNVLNSKNSSRVLYKTVVAE